jgi:hypothetical protein
MGIIVEDHFSLFLITIYVQLVFIDYIRCLLYSLFSFFFARLRKQIVTFLCTVSLTYSTSPLHSSSYSVSSLDYSFFRLLSTSIFFLCLPLWVGVCECWLLYCHHRKTTFFFFQRFKVYMRMGCWEIRVFHEVQINSLMRCFHVLFFLVLFYPLHSIVEPNTFGRQ